ncbi:MAG TPA: adenosylcobalamin-dependent ribonucleoside-diphosphate reductase [Candidatus Thermoplasmatota archaeon]|nr:adenosylcobalamin-dependent ribonucleoside-diphosphate reductase [Candidatus Thermoplasmatota archaeon]
METKAANVLAELPEPKISDNARKVLERRYLNKDESGKPVETPKELFWRVAWNIAQAERNYGADDEATLEWAKKFYALMADLDFLPNSPTLMNAGNELQQLSACFVLPVADSIPGIFDALKWQAIIHKSGGGTGFSFSRLRPKEDFVKSTMGVASGPVSFMKIFDAATQQVKQGGKRRGANMGILRVDHPDILEFIDCKAKLEPESQKIHDERRAELESFGVPAAEREAKLKLLHRSLLSNQIKNFNISVALTDAFMEAVARGDKYDVVSPRTGEVVRQLDAREVLDKIAGNAWVAGEPGLFFVDRSNEKCPTTHVAPIEATNPCGEQDLQPMDSCNLGSIDLDKHVKPVGRGAYEIDWDKLERSVRLATRFLDDVIDMNAFPIPEIHKMSHGNRRIGLGIMGFARMLFKLEIPYDGKEGLAMAQKVMKFINDTSVDESVELAKARGVYGNWYGGKHEKQGVRRRNSYVTTIAPTGTLSMIADTSGGCEPEFSLIWYKNVMDGTHLPYVLDYFIEVAKREGFWREDLLQKILDNRGSARGIKEIPEKWQKVFAVSFDVTSEMHVRMQAAFQEHVEAQVSKTINMPPEATVEDVKKAYVLAYELGCRGITVYRDGSRDDQVMNVGVSAKAATTTKVEVVRDDSTAQPAAGKLVSPEPPAAKPKTIVPVEPVGHGILKPKPRPDIITGTTQRIETGYGPLYLTINEVEGRPFEVFAQIGHGGGYTASFTEAVARLASLLLRSGVPVQEVIDQLEGIRSPKIAWHRGTKINSVPDAIAFGLKKWASGELHKSVQVRVDNYAPLAPDVAPAKGAVKVVADDEREKEGDDLRELVRLGMNPECPECEAILAYEEGCVKCHSCGYSEC